jgi:elongation factor G
MVRVNRLSHPSDSAKPAVVELCDASGRTYTLMLSDRAAAMLGVMLSHYTPVKEALAETIRTGPFRVDPFVPIIQLDIEARDENDRAKIVAALVTLAADGAQIRYEEDAAWGKVKLAGINELQLDQIINALRTSVGAVVVSPPQIAYREQITRRAEIDYTHKRVSFGKGEFARVKLVLEPVPYQDGVTFMGVRARAALGENYITAVERGVRTALAAGPLAGFPLVGVQALLVDGSFHETDSSPRAFQIAGHIAASEALRKGEPALLEPIMRVDIITPEEHVERSSGN